MQEGLDKSQPRESVYVLRPLEKVGENLQRMQRAEDCDGRASRMPDRFYSSDVHAACLTSLLTL